MANKIPRGIQAVSYVNADKTTTTKYRVRIRQKGFTGKSNNYFDSLNEAVSFLKLSKIEKGKELIYSITEHERLEKLYKQQQKEERKSGNNFTFKHFADMYINDYVTNIPITTELIKRNQAMKKAFINRICNTSIVDRYITEEEKEQLGIEHEEIIYRKFGSFDIRTELKPIEINSYIRTRLKGDENNRAIMPVSVARELTYISNIFNKLIHFNENLEHIKNPTRDYDKSLLQNITNIRKRILSSEEEIRFLEIVNNYSNKQLADISKLSLLTSMRKSEIVFLKKSQIKDNFKYIHLPITKSKRSREVYLDETARMFLMSLKPAEKAKDDRFFTYSLMGFSKVFSELMSKSDLKDLHFHDLRRTKISKMLSLGGSDNTILIAKLLGFQSARKFEQIHNSNQSGDLKTQAGMLASHGHSSIDISFKHYLNPVFTEVDKMKKANLLKAKRKLEGLNTEEETELLNLMIELQDS